MVILGLLLLALGALAVLAALFASGGSASLLGFDLDALTIFLVGLVAGAAIWWGLGLVRYGTKREMKLRRERKREREQYEKLSRKFEQTQADQPPEE
ncbi:MAG: hypothetical protein QM714_11615 [Nocardioides sp.]|uniref:hypothetical protein n=1 Tax=Nocardioides sp. TaxID=35761 RepID=UPI0039E34CA2